MFIQILIGISIAVWIWTLMDFYETKFKKLNQKIVWLLLVLFFPLLGTIFYFRYKKDLIIRDTLE
ncbi:PLDc N-terminal domain-containing protein [Gelidibacter sp. DF109]|uniref:PLDc N-terminal domain-containing protein n=2 Tax=Gelidibacter pelagius TaxID=2819985 RepID=A0ABS3SVK8_9FLAO|nr:PLDc N-terminal domain-containing protein [Gelidibacter pelagius]